MKERSWSIRGADQAEWMRRLRAERDNFRTALGWAAEHDPATAISLAASLGKYWELHGDWTEGRRWLERILSLDVQSLAPLDVARAQQVAGTLAMQQEDHQSARLLIERALEEFRRVGDIDRSEWAMNDLAIIAMDADGDIRRARQLFADCLELAKERGSGHLAPLINLGWLAMEVADWDGARAYFDEGLTMAPDDQESAGWCQLGIGTLDWLAGDMVGAQVGFDECVRLWSEIDADSTLVFGLIGQALVARDTGDLVAAKARVGDALALARRLGGGVRYVFCLGLAGSLAAKDGRLEEACTLATATKSLMTQHHWPIKAWFRDELERWALAVDKQLDHEALARSRTAGENMTIGDALRVASQAARVPAAAN